MKPKSFSQKVTTFWKWTVVLLLLTVATSYRALLEWNFIASFTPVGIAQNRPLGAGEPLAVCFYSTGFSWGFGAGYNRFVATAPEFTHSVNVTSMAAATAYIGELCSLAKIRGLTIAAIAIEDHSAPSEPQLNHRVLSPGFYAEVARCVRECGTKRLLFLGCDVAKGSLGEAYAQKLADDLRIEVVAAPRPVGGFDVFVCKLYASKIPVTSLIMQSGAHRIFSPR